MLDLDRFVSRMNDHWTKTLKNVSSDALRATWDQLGEAFNTAVVDSVEALHFGADPRWLVRSPATGTGKSEGLKVYCSLLPRDEHPGVLIVVRLQETAEGVAKSINAMAGREDAIAYHSDLEKRPDPDTLKDWPVLVICHAAFLRGLDLATRHKSNWSKFMAFRDGHRRLAVVDEALELVEHAQVDLIELGEVKGLIASIIGNHQKEHDAIKRVEKALKKVPKDKGDRIMWSEVEAMLEADFSKLMAEARCIRFDKKLLRVDDPKLRLRIANKVERVLHGVHMTIEGWAWKKRQGKFVSANSARLVLPDDAPVAVLLDATAGVNRAYDLLPRMELVKPPEGARNYQNLTINYSLDHNVGRDSCRERGLDGLKEFMVALEAEVTEDSKVLLVCHKDVETLAAGYETKIKTLSTAHFGAIDGRNDWDTYDVVAIYGLPYRPREWAINTLMSTQGVEKNTKGLRSGRMALAREKLEYGQLNTDLVQTINRVRCRRVIDEQGNCHPTRVFIWMPDEAKSRPILDAFKAELPGHLQATWVVPEGSSKMKPRLDYTKVLIAFARNMGRGDQRLGSYVQKELKMSVQRWKTLAVDMLDQNSKLALLLAEANVRYIVKREGKTQRAYLIKAD
jgi:hypothetical protein